jgi:vesicle transport through interaction with t-SNAREs protein 1
MDNSPTALFDSYEQDFQQIVDSLKQKLEGDAKDERAGKVSASMSLFEL